MDCLKEETTKEHIVDAMLKKYEAQREEIEADVEEILNKFRGVKALKE